MENKKKYVVTIARGFGTGGKQVGKLLGEQLGIDCYENRILTLASQLSGKKESELMKGDEKLEHSGIISRLKNFPLSLSPRSEMKKFEANSQLFQMEAGIIKQLAAEDSCIIVGKCADYVLKDYDNVVSVYIEAPRRYTVKRIMERMDVDEKEANKRITMTDKYRADYYKYYTGGNYWTNPVNYDITLNSEKLGIQGCIDMIKFCLKTKLGIEIEI